MFTEHLVAEIARNRESGQFTDFTLICRGREFPVHKLILSCHSKVFTAALRIGMKESTTGKFEMNEEDPFTVERMIQYMYSGTYDARPGMYDSESASRLQMHARVFALADKYQIDELETLSAREYTVSLHDKVDISPFLGSIHDVFNLTPQSKRAMRIAAINFAKNYLGAAMRGSSDLQTRFNDTARDIPDFAQELLESFLMAPVPGRPPSQSYRLK
ncbi:BTB/POZ protein [Xylaria intraflava]|nr:BTB/POZ protein [Xylaria intraflava]